MKKEGFVVIEAVDGEESLKKSGNRKPRTSFFSISFFPVRTVLIYSKN